jgi:hypothetical protein
MSMYLVHLVFFTQYRVFDLDVFFIPAHLIYAIFMGYGLFRALEYLYAGLGRIRVPRLLISGVMAGLLLVLPARQLRANWQLDDYSSDVAINDFYYNVFQLLPEGSAIVGRGGVFGYDMFYFRYVYGMRPDVQMPMAEPGGRTSVGALREATAVYSTVPVQGGQQALGPWAPPRGLTGRGSWTVPVVVGQGAQSAFNQMRGSLVLYELSQDAPALVVEEANPAHEVGAQLDGMELVGYDLDEGQVERGGRVHLTLYWRVVERASTVVVTAIDGAYLERHELGFGNLERYVQEFGPVRDSVVVEDYWLVVPSTVEPGECVLQVGTTSPLLGEGEEVELLSLETLEVVEGGYFSSPFYGWTIQRG